MNTFCVLRFQVPFPFLCFVQVKRYLVEHSGDNIQYIWIDVSCIDVSVLHICYHAIDFFIPVICCLEPYTCRAESPSGANIRRTVYTMCIFDSSTGSPVSLLLRLPTISLSLSFYLCLFLSSLCCLERVSPTFLLLLFQCRLLYALHTPTSTSATLVDMLSFFRALANVRHTRNHTTRHPSIDPVQVFSKDNVRYEQYMSNVVTVLSRATHMLAVPPCKTLDPRVSQQRAAGRGGM